MAFRGDQSILSVLEMKVAVSGVGPKLKLRFFAR
jgi:hypothetical protein